MGVTLLVGLNHLGCNPSPRSTRTRRLSVCKRNEYYSHMIHKLWSRRITVNGDHWSVPLHGPVWLANKEQLYAYSLSWYSRNVHHAILKLFVCMMRIGYWHLRADVKGSDVPTLRSLVEERMRSVDVFSTQLETGIASDLNISAAITPNGMYFHSTHLPLSPFLLLLTQKDMVEWWC